MGHHYQMRYRKGDVEVEVESDEKSFILEQLERLGGTRNPEFAGARMTAPDAGRPRCQGPAGGGFDIAACAALVKDQDSLARWAL